MFQTYINRRVTVARQYMHLRVKSTAP